jgi:sulfonate transport system ATP-binding protein
MSNNIAVTEAATSELQDVSKSFFTDNSEHLVLRDISLFLPPRSITAIIGASGSGKSTLLRILGGLGEGPTHGSVRIDGTTVAPFDRRCAFAFQEARLLPWRSVAQNVALGLPKAVSKHEGDRRVAELLDLVQLSDFANHKPNEISGGMAQRTSLARALARTPALLLLDEPFGALDALTRLQMHDLLLDIHAAEPTTVVFVTHDVDEALVLADSIIVLGTENQSPGAVIQKTVSPLQQRPRNQSDTEFIELRRELLVAMGVELRSESTHN